MTLATNIAVLHSTAVVGAATDSAPAISITYASSPVKLKNFLAQALMQLTLIGTIGFKDSSDVISTVFDSATVAVKSFLAQAVEQTISSSVTGIELNGSITSIVVEAAPQMYWS